MENQHMLYLSQDPSQARQVPAQRPLSMSAASEPPTYDDAMATAPVFAGIDYSGNRRRTFFAEPQHLRYRLEGLQHLVSNLVADLPQLQVVPELPEESEDTLPESMEPNVWPSAPPERNFFDLSPQPKFGCHAVDIMCPACGQQGMTRLRRSPHIPTHFSSLWLCTFGWCCCACLWPYLFNGCWMTSHYCSSCEIFLGSHYPAGCCRLL